MKGQTSNLEVARVDSRGTRRFVDKIVRERPMTIFLNDSEVATLMCTPSDLEPLAVGFLFAEGLVGGLRDVKKVSVDEKDGVVWVETKKPVELSQDVVSRRYVTTGCGRGWTVVDATRGKSRLKIRSKSKLPVNSIPMLMTEFLRKSKLFRLTGGVHSAAICNSRGILVYCEDIGRHSAIDKVVGECILGGIRTKDKILVTTGRISSDIVVKAARSGVSIVISKSAPTDLAVQLARDIGITLVGFARGTRMNVYSKASRIVAISQNTLSR